MKMEKIVTSGIPFANKEPYEYDGKSYEADLANGDKVTIKSEGEWEESAQFGRNFKIVVSTRNGDRRATVNQSSINILIDAFGDDSVNWIGKEVNILTKKGVFGGKKGIALYLVVDGWVLDDYGDLFNPSLATQASTGSTSGSLPPRVDYPTPESEGIDPSNISF